MTSTKQRILERRQQNAELAARDRANRCPICKRALKAVRIVVIGMAGEFCSDDCADEAKDRRR